MSYESLAQTALRLIKRRGKDAKLKTVTTTFAEGDPGTPIRSQTSQDIKLVAVPIEQKYLKGDLLVTDQQVYVAAAGVQGEICATDKIEINGITNRIVELMPIAPGPITVLYIVFLRK